MPDEIGKIKPKRVAVIMKNDGTHEVVDVNTPSEFEQLSFPMPKPQEHRTPPAKDKADKKITR
ncbi:MAG TPA: hypothetical protein PLP17_09575 [Oligoflexia bacterium]|nr:hypothetical protein [Oligoflexia bacterium]